MNILISIGNSDDKLSQRRWADFIAAVRDLLQFAGRVQIHGEWFSAPDKPWQNANWCVEAADPVARSAIRHDLVRIAAKYQQDSIAWTEGEVEFLTPNGAVE